MSTPTRTLLLIEDADIRSMELGKALTDKGFKTITHDAATLSLDEIVAATPDIIVTDLLHDEDDPLHFIASLKNDERLKKVEVFVFSTSISVQTELALRRLKISSFYLKNRGGEALVNGAVQFFEEVVEQDYDEWRSEMDRSTIPTHYAGPPSSVPPPPPGQSEYIATKTGGLIEEELNSIFSSFQAEKEPSSCPQTSEPNCNPDSPENIYAKGLLFLKEENFSAAIDALQSVVNYPPLTRVATLKLGVAHQKKGEHQEAVDALQNASKNLVEPDEKNECFYHLALSQMALGQQKAAYNSLATVYKSDKNYREVKNYLLDLKQQLLGK